MTDKQIIIDGVDVSGCDYFNFTDEHYCDECSSEFGCAICDERPNCNYKQLARKTQSEAKLVKQLQTICDFINNRPETFKGMYGDVAKIITEYAERKEQECEELKSQLTSLGYADAICALEIDLEHKTQECEELTKNYFIVIQQRNKAEKTLTEIKEIVEWHTTSNDSEDVQEDMKQILQKINECDAGNQ